LLALDIDDNKNYNEIGENNQHSNVPTKLR